MNLSIQSKISVLMTMKKKNDTHPQMNFEQLYWNCDDDAIKNPDYVDYDWDLDNLDLWEDSFLAVYRKVYLSGPTYDAYYLWTKHIDDKIEGVIKSWNKGLCLSPIFCTKVYDCSLNVWSGHHRFSVARAFYEKSGRDFKIPFLIKSKDHSWIEQVLPNAKYLKTIVKPSSDLQTNTPFPVRKYMKLENTFELFLEHKQYMQCGSMLEQEILPYVTPILANPYINAGLPFSNVEPDENILYPHGSGSFINYGDKTMLITCNHVVNFDKDGKPVQSPLYWPKWNDGEFHEIEKRFACHLRPKDVAVANISSIFNSLNFPNKKAIKQDSFQKEFHDTKNELFFAMGFPTKEPFLLLTNAMILKSGDPEYDENCFVLKYDNLLTEMPDNISGMSGALVWNTKIAECIERGADWTPSMAEVAGIIFSGDKDDGGIGCVKIEKIDFPILVDCLKKNENSIARNIVV